MNEHFSSMSSDEIEKNQIKEEKEKEDQIFKESIQVWSVFA